MSRIRKCLTNQRAAGSATFRTETLGSCFDFRGDTVGRERVVDSLANENEPGSTAAELSALIHRLGPRWFLVRGVHATPNTTKIRNPLNFCPMRRVRCPSRLLGRASERSTV